MFSWASLAASDVSVVLTSIVAVVQALRGDAALRRDMLKDMRPVAAHKDSLMRLNDVETSPTYRTPWTKD
jgi:hypothetical protein